MNGSGGRGLRWWALRLVLVPGVGFLLARLGPFGTFDEIEAAARLGYWVGLTLLMWLQSVAALVILGSVPPVRHWPRPAVLVTAAALGSVPTAFQVAWAEMLLRVERDLTLVDVVQIYGDVLLLAVPLLLVTHWKSRHRAGSAEGPPKDGSVDWLMAKLPPQRRGRLLALNSEDHYLRVRTSAGSELIHMRFGDAVSRLGDAGAQVHRSWWVATGAVKAQSREGDRIMLELRDGTRVPVSRSYAMGAREAGLIAG